MPATQALIKNGVFIFILSLIFNVNSLAAANPNLQAPDKMLEAATIKMLRSINNHRSEIKKSPEKLKSLVEDIILPHLDFISASKMVMGKYWRRAEKAQKIKFIKQFRILLLRFYSSALSEYLSGSDKLLREDLIHYFPHELNEGDTATTVRAEIQLESGQAIPIRYRMHLTRKGWKIYDVSVEGISMITTYKNNFASQFKTQGIDSLIASLEEKNKHMMHHVKHAK